MRGLGLAGRLAVLGLPALALAGCARGGASLTQGGWSDAVSSFGADHNFSFSCSKFDPTTGFMTDQVTVNRNLAPDAAVVAQAGAAIQGVIGLVGAAGKVAKPVAGPMGSARDAAPLTVASCLGEHGINFPMPLPPNPQPPQQGAGPQGTATGPSATALQQPSPTHDPGDRPAMLESPGP